MKTRWYLLLAVVLLLGAFVLAGAGGRDCGQKLSEWDRAIGSLAPYPETFGRSGGGGYEHVTVYMCSDGTLVANVDRYDVTREKR